MYHNHRHEPYDCDKLWVISVVSNPARFRSRYDLYGRFEDAVFRAGANLITVELALGNRPFEVTDHRDGRHLQLRTTDEIWHKENMINLGVQLLPEDWRYVAWVDADVEFVRPDWAFETIEQLQHFSVVQMFRSALDLGPKGETINVFDGFVWAHVNGLLGKQKPGYGNRYHPGFAWAARREAFNDLGGLIDFSILGSADHQMAWALVGRVLENTPRRAARSYREMLLQWQHRADRYVRGNIGYVDGTLVHHWHGRKAERAYASRWNILFEHGFDPVKDLKRDWQGLWQFTHEGARMRADLRQYFRQRNEDATD